MSCHVGFGPARVAPPSGVAGVVELVDTHVSQSCWAQARPGSNPGAGTRRVFPYAELQRVSAIVKFRRL